MRHRRSRPTPLPEWPPALRHLFRAAELECPSGHAAVLRELTALAAQKLPSRGLLDPAARGDDTLFAAIEAVANAHLGLRDARTEWRAALDAADVEFDVRDRLERAALHVQTVSDTSYYYTGLTFGLAFVYVYR